MKEISLEAAKRTMKGTRGARKLRMKNIIPCILYGEGKFSMPLELNKKDIQKIVRGGSWESVIIDLKIKDENSVQTVMIKDLQIDPLRREVLHIDLCKISLKEKVKVHVAIEVLGEAPGVKNNGGILEHITREVEIECMPAEIPENIKVDVSSLEIGDTIIVKDLNIPDGVKIITDEEKLIVNVIPPTVLEEKVEEVAPLTEAAEPEVIGRGKKEEEVEEEKREPEKEE